MRDEDEYPRQTTRYCKACGYKLKVYREEYEMLCDGCMTAWPMPQAMLNDLKKMALEWTGDRESFAVSTIIPEFARHAWDLAKKAVKKPA